MFRKIRILKIRSKLFRLILAVTQFRPCPEVFFWRRTFLLRYVCFRLSFNRVCTPVHRQKKDNISHPVKPRRVDLVLSHKMRHMVVDMPFVPKQLLIYEWVTAKISLNSLDRIFRILNFPKPGLNRGTRS